VGTKCSDSAFRLIKEARPFASLAAVRQLADAHPKLLRWLTDNIVDPGPDGDAPTTCVDDVVGFLCVDPDDSEEDAPELILETEQAGSMCEDE